MIQEGVCVQAVDKVFFINWAMLFHCGSLPERCTFAMMLLMRSSVMLPISQTSVLNLEKT